LYQSVLAQKRRKLLTACPFALIVVAILLIALSILTRRIDHDEGQYVAALALARHGWPYRDFAYLQTPLQPILLSPLAMLPAGWLLVGARAVNGMFGIVTLIMLAAALDGRATKRSTMIALVAFICSEPFLFASSIARNDALPMALIAASLFALLRGLEFRQARWFAAAGLLLGLASSAKISAAVLIVPAALFLVLRIRRLGAETLAVFVAGVVVGLLPTAAFAVFTPAQFKFDVFSYSLAAPRQWWTAVGDSGWLQPGFRILRLVGFAAQGCGLAGLAAASIDRRRTDDRLLLDLMIVGGMVTAYLPEPAFTQYLVPLLPPVAVRLAIAIDSLPNRLDRKFVPLIVTFSIAGLFQTTNGVVRTVMQGNSLIRAVEQGRLVATAAAGQPIVTLSPERVAGADTNLDGGFVTGPFLFRTFGQLGSEAAHFGYSPNWQRIGAALEARQPSFILTGGESETHPPLFPNGLDAPLISWAADHRYERVALPGGATLWERCGAEAAIKNELEFRCGRAASAAPDSDSVPKMQAAAQ
jgi:hypothetical protein